MSSHEPPEILQLTARAKEGAQLTVSPLAGQTDLICIVCNGFCGWTEPLLAPLFDMGDYSVHGFCIALVERRQPTSSKRNVPVLMTAVLRGRTRHFQICQRGSWTWVVSAPVKVVSLRDRGLPSSVLLCRPTPFVKLSDCRMGRQNYERSHRSYDTLLDPIRPPAVVSFDKDLVS